MGRLTLHLVFRSIKQLQLLFKSKSDIFIKKLMRQKIINAVIISLPSSHNVCMCLNDLTAETAQVAIGWGKGVTVTIAPEKSDLWKKEMCDFKNRENLESQWSKRDIKPLSKWIGTKLRPVKAITAVKLNLSGTVSHCVHMLVLLEAFRGGVKHCYLKIQLLLYPPPAYSKHNMTKNPIVLLYLHFSPAAVKQG